MENEEYKFPKTKQELFKLKRLDLCCFCHRVPKEISQIKNITPKKIKNKPHKPRKHPSAHKQKPTPAVCLHDSNNYF